MAPRVKCGAGGPAWSPGTTANSAGTTVTVPARHISDSKDEGRRGSEAWLHTGVPFSIQEHAPDASPDGEQLLRAREK